MPENTALFDGLKCAGSGRLTETWELVEGVKWDHAGRDAPQGSAARACVGAAETFGMDGRGVAGHGSKSQDEPPWIGLGG